MGDRPTYGEQIRTARRQRMMTLRDVAAASGVTLGYLSEIERDLASPSIAVAQKLADALGVNPIVTADYQGAYGDGERAGFVAGYAAACAAMSRVLANRQAWWEVPSPEMAFGAWQQEEGRHGG